MSYVIQEPNSDKNQTNKYRIVDSDEWAKYTNGQARTYPLYGTYYSYEEAEIARDTFNKEAQILRHMK